MIKISVTREEKDHKNKTNRKYLSAWYTVSMKNYCRCICVKMHIDNSST